MGNAQVPKGPLWKTTAQSAFPLHRVQPSVRVSLVKTLKKTPLTVRRCPTAVHDALKQSATANHRSLNGEALTWLEKQAAKQKPVTGRELAAALRRWHKQFTREEHLQIAEGIEQARRRMSHEHLH